MSIPEITPGPFLSGLIAACETFCEHECCGIDAFDFSPLHAGAYLCRHSGSIEREDVQRLLNDLDALHTVSDELAPGEHGFICSLAGTNQYFTRESLQELMRRIRWTLGCAPKLLAVNKELEEGYDSQTDSSGSC